MLIAKQLKNQKVLFSIDWIASRPLGKPQLSRIEFIHDVLTTFMYRLNELYNFIPPPTMTNRKGLLISLHAPA